MWDHWSCFYTFSPGRSEAVGRSHGEFHRYKSLSSLMEVAKLKWKCLIKMLNKGWRLPAGNDGEGGFLSATWYTGVCFWEANHLNASKIVEDSLTHGLDDGGGSIEAMNGDDITGNISLIPRNTKNTLNDFLRSPSSSAITVAPPNNLGFIPSAFKNPIKWKF